jgi:hypothetical protein
VWREGKDRIEQHLMNKGYMDIEELNQYISSLNKYGSQIRIQDTRSSAADLSVIADVAKIDFVIEGDLLPFKAMLYLALEKENFDEAEFIRMNWVSYLHKVAYELNAGEFNNRWNKIKKGGRNDTIQLKEINAMGGIRGQYGPFPLIPEMYTKIKFIFEKLDGIVMKIQHRLGKLQIVGLTDPMLINLRKELTLALRDKKWDDVQKIQNIITARVKELTPSTPLQPQIQMIETPQVVGSGGQTTVAVQQPDKIQIEQLPRYGVSDYGRVLSIIGGRTMSDKDAATLKLFDMLIGR